MMAAFPPSRIGAKLMLQPSAGVPHLALRLDEPGLRDFLRMAEASPAMIWMADVDARCTYVNPAWLEFRGTDFDHEVNGGRLGAIHPDDRARLERSRYSSARTRTPFRISYRVRNAAGVYCDAEDWGSPWCDTAGILLGYLGTVVIATQRCSDEAMRQLALLTTRERQVTILIAEGCSTKAIASRLGVSYKTADSHRTHVLKKLHLHETASLARFAVRSGLIRD